MVRILPPQPTFGQSLVDTLINAGGNVGSSYFEGKNERSKQLGINRPRTQSALYGIFKQYKADPAYSPESRQKAEQKAQQYLEKGYSPYQAATAAYEDMVAGFPETISSKGKTKSQMIQEEAEKVPRSKTILEEIQGFANKPADEAFKSASNFVKSPIAAATSWTREQLDRAVEKKNIELAAKNLAEKERVKENKIEKPIDELTYKEILNLPAEAVSSLPMEDQLKIGKKISEGAKLGTDVAFTKGLDPTGLVQRAQTTAEEKNVSPVPEKNEFTSTPLAVAEGTGTMLKDLALFKAAGKASTTPGKVGAAAGLFGTEKALKTTIGEGKVPTVGELAGAATFGAAGELVGPLLSKSLEFIKKIPRAYESLKSAVSASKGAATEEKIIEEAVKNLESRGISVVKAAEGDAKALNEIQKEAIKVSDTFKQAEKYNRKELEKVRGEKAEKLVQSPLEEYYAPKKEVKSRPETVEKEKARIAPLEALIKQNERRLLNRQYEILSAQGRLREAAATLTDIDKSRINSIINTAKIEHQKALNEIAGAKFEIKYGHPPKTTAEIKEQIAKSFEEIREGIKNPTAEKVEKLRKSLETNKEALEKAEKLVARGELPGAPVFDEYIKIKQEYVKAYGELIDELKEFVKQKKGVRAYQARVNNAEELIKVMEATREHAKASIINQIDKRKAIKTLEGPSGALWKNLLKDVRTDVDAFKKDWIKANKISSAQEVKTAEAAKRSINTPQEEAKILKGSEETVKEPLKEAAEKVKKGTATEEDVQKVATSLDKWLLRLSKVQGGFTRGAVIGAVQGLVEEFLDVKAPAGLIAALWPGNSASRGSAYGGSVIAHKVVNSIFTKTEAAKLRKLKNTPAFNERRRELEKRYSAERVNKILKEVDQ